jgi:lysophospholipase L1-like esterase
MQHIVLLGDSIFDNGVYVGSEPDVATQLKQLAPADWKITLCAVDGDRTEDVIRQLRKVPAGATHLFLSVGGNDALSHSHLLSDTTTPGMQILEYLDSAARGFESSYRKLIQKISNLRLPLAVFTIYNGNLEKPLVKAARAAVAVFNDKIYQVAGEYSVPVLELRRICNEPSDYANPIEPSSSGGKKIAASILRHVQSLVE